MAEKCYSCHSAEAAKKRKLKGGLQLDTKAGLLQGGDSGLSLVPGKPEESLMLIAMRHEEELEMPPKEKLPDSVIADFTKWIIDGAYDPREGNPVSIVQVDYTEGRKHWAYQPLHPGPTPKVRNSQWNNGKIDQYLLAEMEATGLQPAVDGDPLTVLRRICFDLTGLPPTLEQVQLFEQLGKREVPAAYKKLVKELLDSPQYGEHWARHWLDGIRYNPQLETATYYRNWVIKVLNQDMSYYEFLKRQIAGDQLPAKDQEEAADNLVATQMIVYNRFEADFVEGSLEVIGQQIFGISLNCAKCHDHKYDAVSQQDYYALAGIYKSCKIPKSARDGVEIPGTKTKVLTLYDEPKNIGHTHLLLGGDVSRRGDLIPRRLPKVFFQDEPELIEYENASGRLELANWVGDKRSPLSSRVMANRVWLRLMGKGIVPTPNDFGTNGDPPTHPELLDYLAQQLMDSDGSLKSLIQEIVLSRAYQQSAFASEMSREIDFANTLYSRATPKRLQMEQIMDQLLFVCGTLELGMVDPVPAINKMPSQRQRDKSYRGPRAIYCRNDTFFRDTFDAANVELLVTERERSVTAPQALHFLNSDMIRQISETSAKYIEHLADKSESMDKLDIAYRLYFGRPPTSTERELGQDFIEKHGFLRYAHTLLCTNEFIHLN